jgi:hypothetical protein
MKHDRYARGSRSKTAGGEPRVRRVVKGGRTVSTEKQGDEVTLVVTFQRGLEQVARTYVFLRL